ncbi:MAG: hypothetical protein KA248_01325 [Kiritimatiellae bacterium]|nr:hypothetical protein [Kiritimatiellia bacterium]
MTPRLIHMVYFPWDRDQRLLADPDAFDHRPYENMRRYAPDFEVRLWTYPRAREWCRANYPAIWACMEGLARPTMMVDVLRWLVVYHFGGVYWQYDMNPLAPMARMVPGSGREARLFTEFVLSPEECRRMADEPIRRGEPEEAARVMNQAFSAVPRHRFIKAVLDLILERATALTPRRDYDILYICANAAVSTAWARFGRTDPSLELLSRAETRRLLRVQYKGTWRVNRPGEKDAAPSGGSRAAAFFRRRVKSLPGFFRLVRTHPYEQVLAGPRNPSRMDEASASFDLGPILGRLADAYGIRSVLEFPCGDAAGRGLDGLAGLKYVGADLDRAVLRQNGKRARAGGAAFRFLNPAYSRWPRADLVVCRNFFTYLDDRGIREALRTMARSGSACLLTTTYPLLNGNWDGALGDWRPLHLALPPFSFPEPLALFPDPEPERRPDRALGLWKLAEIEKRLGA